MTEPVQAKAPDVLGLLNRVASAGLADRRSMQCETPHEVLGFLADAIGTTVLPRTLLLFVNGQERLRVVASAGRLLWVCGKDGRNWSDPSSSDTDAMCAWLLAICDPPGLAEVTTALVADPPEATRNGLAAHVLLTAAGLVSAPSDISDVFDLLVEGLHEALFALYLQDGSLPLSVEGFDVSQPLRSWIEEKFDQLAGADPAWTDGSLVFYRVPHQSDLACALTTGRSPAAALLISVDDMLDVAEYWANLPRMTFEVAPIPEG